MDSAPSGCGAERPGESRTAGWDAQGLGRSTPAPGEGNVFADTLVTKEAN